jgi:hypothetical protein
LTIVKVADVVVSTVDGCTMLPFTEPKEFRSVDIDFGGIGLFLPFSVNPFGVPLAEKALPFCDDLLSQLLELDLPLGREFGPVSLNISPSTAGLTSFIPPFIDSYCGSDMGW